METQLTVGEEIFLDIKRIGINGEGIGYYKRLAIFVNGVLPKENVLVKITKLHRGYAEAELLELKTPSKDRVAPFCPYYTKCGGCSLQHVNYEATRDIKRDILMESITRYTKINPRSFEVKPTILMKNPKNYRAKVNLPAKNGIHGAVFGLYAPNSEKFIRIKGCDVQNESINEIMDEVGKAMDKFAVKAYDPKNKKGYVRYLVARASVYSKEIQVTLILTKELASIKELAEEIMKNTKVTSVYYSINNNFDDVIILGVVKGLMRKF